MRGAGLALVAILLLIAVPVAAGVYNVTLTGVGNVGVSGAATTIWSGVTGPNPYQSVEVNIRMDKAPASGQVYEAFLMDSKTKASRSLGALRGDTLNARQQFTSFSESAPYDTLVVALEQTGSVCPAPVTIAAQGSLPGASVSSTDFRAMAVLPPDEAFQRSAIKQRTGLNDDQITNLRMQAFDYTEIAMAANAASRGNRSINDVVAMLNQGQTWDQIASTYNTTTAMLNEPMPMEAVAGSQQQIGVPAAPGTVTVPRYYMTYYGGRPIITESEWKRLYSMGYNWKQVAMAANVATRTGESVDDILRMATVQGQTFLQIAMSRCIDYDDIRDVSAWPFGDRPSAMSAPSTSGSSSSMPSGTGASSGNMNTGNGTSNY